MPIVRSTGAVVAARELLDPPGFDPTYGFTTTDLMRCEAPSVQDEPDDFDAFWTGVRDRARAVDPDPCVTGWRPWRYRSGIPDDKVAEGYEVADLVYTSVDGARIGGWVVRPVDGADRIAVCGHGYDGRAEPACDDAAPSALCVYPVARGLPVRSSVPGIGWDGGQTPHVTWDIESPQTYAVVKSAADFSVAATVAQSLLPGAQRMIYHGASFGGGVGAMTLSIDDRFDGAVLGVPTFGNQVVRVTQRSLGSGQFARDHVRAHPSTLETLRYADAASAARRVRIPVFATPALSDAVVPPPGQFSVINSLAGPVWRHVLAGGHGEWADFDTSRRSSDPRDWHTVRHTGHGRHPEYGRLRQAAAPTADCIDDFLSHPTRLFG